MYVGIDWNIRNVELKFCFYPGMRLYFLMFITAVCFLFIHTLVLGSETSIELSPQNNHLLDHRQFTTIQSLSTHGLNCEKRFA